MGLFGGDDSASSLARKGDGLGLISIACNPEQNIKERNKALESIATLGIAKHGDQASETLIKILEILNDYYVESAIRGPFTAVFMKLLTNRAVEGRLNPDYICESYPGKRLLERMKSKLVVDASIKRSRHTLSFNEFREADPDRLQLLPMIDGLFTATKRSELLFMLTDPNPILRAYFLEQLAVANEKTYIKVILELTLDPYVEVRQSALRALATIGKPMVEPLIAFLQDNGQESPELVDFCARAFNQPKIAILEMLLNPRLATITAKSDEASLKPVKLLMQQMSKCREPKDNPLFLRIFETLDNAKAPPPILHEACFNLDPTDSESHKKLEYIASNWHASSDIAREILFKHMMGSGSEKTGGNWDIINLIEKNMIEIKALGESISLLNIEIISKAPVDLKIRIPAGILFLASGNWQDMVTTIAHTAKLGAGASVKIRLSVACARAELPIPNAEQSFRKIVRASGKLETLTKSLGDTHRYSTLALQAAVWAVTDGYSASKIQDRLVDATTRTKVVTQAHLNEARNILGAAGINNVL